MIIQGDCLAELRKLDADSIDCCITSPPYWVLRDYGVAGQIGLEQTPQEFIKRLCEVFAEVRRVLKPTGTCWINMGDTYGGRPGTRQGSSGQMADRRVAEARIAQRRPLPKQLMGMPWRLAFALQDDGWCLRQDIIWSKPNPMPESVRDRFTKSHEYIFLLTKSLNYFFDQEIVLEPVSPNTHARLSQKVQDQIGSARAHGGAKPAMKAVGRKFDPRQGNKNNSSFDEAMAIMPTKRNKRSVWTVGTKPFKGAHFATYPEELIVPMIKAGCPEGGIVLDPFFGAGTTGVVAQRLNRQYIGIELNPEYVEISKRRLAQKVLV